MKIDPIDLANAIKNTHNCTAKHVRDEPVKETFDGETVWEGVVSVFEVDHALTDTCFAWSHPIEGSKNHKYYCVLKVPPINTPLDAVRASIVNDFRNGKTG